MKAEKCHPFDLRDLLLNYKSKTPPVYRVIQEWLVMVNGKRRMLKGSQKNSFSFSRYGVFYTIDRNFFYLKERLSLLLHNRTHFCCRPLNEDCQTIKRQKRLGISLQRT